MRAHHDFAREVWEFERRVRSTASMITTDINGASLRCKRHMNTSNSAASMATENQTLEIEAGALGEFQEARWIPVFGHEQRLAQAEGTRGQAH